MMKSLTLKTPSPNGLKDNLILPALTRTLTRERSPVPTLALHLLSPFRLLVIARRNQPILACV